jgi:large subunit ribosomal protein L54
MTGLNYIKNKPDIVALEDHEYPEWLWKLLDDKSKNKKKDGGVDVSCTSCYTSLDADVPFFFSLSSCSN